MNFRFEVSVAALATVAKEDMAKIGVLNSNDRRALSLTCWLAICGACHAEAADRSNVARRALADIIVGNYQLVQEVASGDGGGGQRRRETGCK